MISKLNNIALLALLLTSSIPMYGAVQRLKIEGTWTNNLFQIHKVKVRDAFKDPNRIRVTGFIEELDIQSRKLSIGSIVIYWTALEDDSLSALKVGEGVELNATLEDNSAYFLDDVELANLTVPHSLEVIGAVSFEQREGGYSRVSIAGITARVPVKLYSNGKVRLRRLDDKRPADQLTFLVNSTEFTVGGELGLNSSVQTNYDLDQERSDDELEFSQQVQIEIFAESRVNHSAFLEIKMDNEFDYDLPFQKTGRETKVSIGEAWLHFENPFKLPVSIQIGRQNFSEEREWWWDEDLDAVRIYYSSDQFQFQLAFAEPVIPDNLGSNKIDAEDDDIFRMLAVLEKRFTSELSVILFYLHHNDHSGTSNLADIVNQNQEDEEDSELDWFGARFFGELAANEKREITYWLDWGYVTGNETVLEYDDFSSQQLIVVGKQSRKRRGWAVDSGINYLWLQPYQPSLTLAYAYGSGRSNSNRTYRETGLNDNNNKFNGVDRFRYYGELSRPELSNISITTVSFGLRPWPGSSLELIHHAYFQDHRSRDHTLRIDQDANGLSKNLGQEIDFVTGIEHWKHLELEITAGYFWSGDAFDDSGSAWLFKFKFNYNF